MITLARGPRLAFILVIILTTVGCDQMTKHVAKVTLGDRVHPVRILQNGMFSLQYAENTGGFLSLGSSLPDGLRFWLLTVFTGVILSGIAVILLTNRALARVDALALALLLSGGLGNLIDRVLRDGTVVDFMVMGIGPLHTGVFNVADVAVMTGIFLLFASKLFVSPQQEGVANGPQDS